jgi:hypothetical protein
MHPCSRCNAGLDDAFRFCPHCGQAQRVKVVEHFRGDRRLDDGALRVSVYLTEPQHVRFSIWRDGVAEAALSLEPAEAARLSTYLSAVVRHRPRSLLAAARARLASG